MSIKPSINRFSSTILDSEKSALLEKVKESAQQLEKDLRKIDFAIESVDSIVDRLNQSFIKLEECVMWAGKTLKAQQDLEDTRK